MRREQRWRYYCDHCGKAGGHAGHMRKHERGCTLNPERVCGIHSFQSDEHQPTMEALRAALVEDLAAPPPDYANTPWPIPKLRNVADGCPACILAALRQCADKSHWFDFDFKKELDGMWSDVNAKDRW